MNNLNKKNILITGATKGLGKAIAKQLKKYNCIVCIAHNH